LAGRSDQWNKSIKYENLLHDVAIRLNLPPHSPPYLSSNQPSSHVLQATANSHDMQKKVIYNTNIAATMAIRPAATLRSLTTLAPAAKAVGLAVDPVAVALIVTFPAE
jgi:hypothetical protein